MGREMLEAEDYRKLSQTRLIFKSVFVVSSRYDVIRPRIPQYYGPRQSVNLFLRLRALCGQRHPPYLMNWIRLVILMLCISIKRHKDIFPAHQPHQISTHMHAYSNSIVLIEHYYDQNNQELEEPPSFEQPSTFSDQILKPMTILQGRYCWYTLHKFHPAL